MTGLAIALVISAGLIHASWNYLLKKSGGGLAFMWLFAALSALFYAPFALGILWWQRDNLSATGLAFIAVSAIVHTAYFLMLERGYRFGDLSLVYPLARATGPLITIVVAVLLLDERPGALALCGAGLVVGGAFFLTGNPATLRRPGASRGVMFALLTGFMIAAYTLTDKQAVAVWAVHPIVLDWGANVGRVLLLSPVANRGREQVAAAWRQQRVPAIAIALLCPLSYILVLTALTFTPVSYVAPAREISILFAAIMGTHLLREGQVGRRLLSAAAMALGVVALAIG
jgi:drug/metabolite transporter (DMT)-like permease